MRRKTSLLLILALAGCGATAQQREMQAIKTIEATQKGIVKALDFNVIDADEGTRAQAATRAATKTLRDAIAARRAGRLDVASALLSAVFNGLAEATRILEGKKK